MSSISLSTAKVTSILEFRIQQTMARELSDEELMSEYARGSITAFEQLYARHKGGLYRFLLRQCQSHDIAEELFQDIWIKVINAKDNYLQSAKFTTYLYRIAHNRLIDYYRHLSSAQHSRRIQGDHQLAIEQTGDPESQLDPLEQSELGESIKRAIMALPQEQREALLMQQEGGLSLAEIADITGTSRETVKSRLRYAMNKLREQLGELKS
jgi:RNA polymerase sigma-70 factor (ECF subfamily)